LIAARVAESDCVQAVLLDGAVEEGAAQIACLVFDLRAGCGCVFDGDRKAEFGGERADKGFISIGCGAPEMMINVEDEQFAGELAAQLMEDVQEDDGIGTTGDGDADALGRRKHVVTMNVGGDSREEG
jgi:hypothetical protein